MALSCSVGIGPPPTSLFLAIVIANGLVFTIGLAVVRAVWRSLAMAAERVAWPAPLLDVSPETDGACCV